MGRLAPLLVLAACGRFGFGELAPPAPDAAAPGGDASAIVAPTGGLVAYWPLDSREITDVVGGHNGSCTSCPTPSAGIAGGAAQFDGAATCVTVNGLQGWSDATFTISAFVQSTTMSGPVVVHESINGCPSPAMRVSRGAGLVQLNTTGNTPHNEAWSGPIAGAGWHHVAVSWDGSRQTVYLDGQCACTLAQPLGPLDQTQPFTIGCYPTEAPASYFSGALDELRIYNRVLTLDEIGQVYGSVTGLVPSATPCSATCASAPPP